MVWVCYQATRHQQTNEKAGLIPLEDQTSEAGLPVPVSAVKYSPSHSWNSELAAKSVVAAEVLASCKSRQNFCPAHGPYGKRKTSSNSKITGQKFASCKASSTSFTPWWTISQNTTTGKRNWYCMKAAAPMLSVPWRALVNSLFVYTHDCRLRSATQNTLIEQRREATLRTCRTLPTKKHDLIHGKHQQWLRSCSRTRPDVEIDSLAVFG